MTTASQTRETPGVSPSDGAATLAVTARAHIHRRSPIFTTLLMLVIAGLLIVPSISSGGRALAASGPAVRVTSAAGHQSRQTAGRPVLQLAPILYAANDGHTETLTPWQGQYVSVLVEPGVTRDPTVMGKLVGAIDRAWEYYAATTGQLPAVFHSLNGRGEIAEVASTSCGGAACSYLGATGTEWLTRYFESMYQQVAQNNLYDQVPFYELGRNFWFWGPQLAFHAPDNDPVMTGYAVWMRFVSMAAAGVDGAPFNGTPFPMFAAQVADLARQYEADPSLTFARTLAANKSPGLYGGTDFWASLMMQLAQRHGGQRFITRFWHTIGGLPATTSTAGAMTNWVQAASFAACVDLGPVFYDRWGFPQPDGSVTPRPAADTVPEPPGSCPSATPSPVPTATPSPTPTATLSPTTTTTPSLTPIGTPSYTTTTTPSPTLATTPSFTPTATPHLTSTTTPSPALVPRPTATPTVATAVKPVFSVLGAKVLSGNSNPARARSSRSLSSVRVHQTVKLVVDVKLSGISGPTPAAFGLRVTSGPATVSFWKQAIILSSSKNGTQSFWVYWTPARAGFDQLTGTFFLGRRHKHAVSPSFSVTTCRTQTVHGIECLNLGGFSQFVSQGPDTPARAAGPVGSWPLVPKVRIVSRIRTVQHNPKITVLFWGAQWHHHHRIIAQLLSFYSRLSGSAYNAALSQYNNAGNNPTLVGAWIDPVPPAGVKGVSPFDAISEVERISRLIGLSLNPSSQVIVMLPPGISNAGPTRSTGAYHGVIETEAEWKSGLNPYVFRHGLISVSRWLPGLDPSEYGAVFTEAASHEWAESVTDPNPGAGFVDASNNPVTNRYGQEIADVCRTAGTVIRNGVTLARFYSVKARACVAPPLGPKTLG